MFNRNLQLKKSSPLSSWRKVAMGTWKGPDDPSVYGITEFRAEKALAYIEQQSRKNGCRVTLTHFAGKALAETIRRHPEINRIMRFGRLYPRTDIDVFLLVATDMKGEDLSGISIRNADRKSVIEIASEVAARVKDIRSNADQSFKGMKRIIGYGPGLFSRPLLRFAGFLMYGLNLWTPLLGCPKDPFGSVMITNVGSLGLQVGLAPLVPYSRCPLMIAIGAVTDSPVVENGEVKAGKVIRIGATIDHRLIDGVHASHMARTIEKIFLDPETELGG